jgi:acetyl-CoA carboxylase carboxyl transferase subunit alpha
MSSPRHYLDFERPIADLEAKIEELSRLSDVAEAEGGAGYESEVEGLRRRAEEMRSDIYGGLDAWQKTQVARHPDRPHFVDYIQALIDDFVELKGDRAFADDQAIMGGTGVFRGRPVVVIGHEKGNDTQTRVKHNFGMPRPEGYRKAVRLMDLAERFNLPVISFVDTAGAYPGKEGEERGQGEAIARSTERCLTLGVPMVAVIAGEGSSGGALAIAAANKVLALEHSIYTVIAPESGSSILYRDRAQAPHMARSMKITSQDLIGFGVVDRIIPEPTGGAHADREAAMREVGDAVEAELEALATLDPKELRQQRADRFYAIGAPGKGLAAFAPDAPRPG